MHTGNETEVNGNDLLKQAERYTTHDGANRNFYCITSSCTSSVELVGGSENEKPDESESVLPKVSTPLTGYAGEGAQASEAGER